MDKLPTKSESVSADDTPSNTEPTPEDTINLHTEPTTEELSKVASCLKTVAGYTQNSDGQVNKEENNEPGEVGIENTCLVPMVSAWHKPYDVLIPQAIKATRKNAEEGVAKCEIINYILCNNPQMRRTETVPEVGRAIKRMLASYLLVKTRPGRYLATAKGYNMQYVCGQKFDRRRETQDYLNKKAKAAEKRRRTQRRKAKERKKRQAKAAITRCKKKKEREAYEKKLRRAKAQAEIRRQENEKEIAMLCRKLRIENCRRQAQRKLLAHRKLCVQKRLCAKKQSKSRRLCKKLRRYQPICRKRCCMRRYCPRRYC